MARVAVLAVVFVSLGISIAVNGCGGSSSSGGTGGAGGAAGKVARAGTAGRSPLRCSAATGRDLATPATSSRPAAHACTGTFSTAAPPAPAGGAFAGGTYNLVSQTFYGSADAESTSSPAYRSVTRMSSPTSPRPRSPSIRFWTTGTLVARSHVTAALSGMTATFTQICPAPDAGSIGAAAPSSPRPLTRSRCSGRRRSGCSRSPSTTRRRRRRCCLLAGGVEHVVVREEERRPVRGVLAHIP